uniref:Spookier n=1 Tax=Drosophila melanogaster TaxID=7227 RepID=A8Y592_DROME|nr:spookier [Drosophila melanogaster]EDP28053.2 spookier [Drosophila melanogaster]|eukprot:NP_001104460.2 spookier [Drosophila melanogaster]
MLTSVFYVLFAIAITIILISYVFLLLKCKQKAFVVIGLLYQEKKYQCFDQAPGPHPWPIIGNINLLGRFQYNPFYGFGTLTKKYGDIYSLSLGHTRCIVVNNVDLIKEVLNKNGKYFGGRPDFFRYHKLFGGDRNNSLALCDWSQLQQKRRNLARRHCSPRESSSYFSKMSEIGGLEVNQLLDQLTNISSGYPCDVKPLILAASANMFCQYMCSVRFNYSDKGFQKIIEYFDEIFWEINQGYSFDYIPWLVPFYCNHISRIVHWSASIRKFILERIVNHRESNININEPDKDFTDALLKSLKEDKNVSRNTIIFMLEDFIGGHSAVGNLVMLALAYIAKNPTIALHIRNEVDTVSAKGIRRICLYDMNVMPYTMASISEVLRYSSSPIVPHVAMEDTVIKGFGVRKGTIVFINNYVLNMSESFWNHPEQFDPERFLENNFTNNKESGLKCDDNKRTEFIRKNDNDGSTKSKKYGKQNLNNKLLKKSIPQFLPFSVGKRTCIGQSLVRGFGFLLLANIIQNYNVNSADFSKIKLEKSSIALPKKCFKLSLRPRT